MHPQNTENILAGPDIKPRTVGESQAKASWIINSAEEVGVAGPHTSPTTRWRSKSSPRMEPPGNQTPRQTPNSMAQNNPRRDETSRQNMERSQSTHQKPCQMAKLCEGPMFPWGMVGNYIYIWGMAFRRILIYDNITYKGKEGWYDLTLVYVCMVHCTKRYCVMGCLADHVVCKVSHDAVPFCTMNHTHAHQVRICHHDTDGVCTDTRCWTKPVILVKPWQ